MARARLVSVSGSRRPLLRNGIIPVLQVVIDTREQNPWHFDHGTVDVVRSALPTGDYAVAGDLGFAIERKSLDDFLGTISSGWDRFSRELSRAREAGFSMPIIVEGSRDEIDYIMLPDGAIEEPRHNHPKVTPAFVRKRIAQILMAGGTVFFSYDPFLSSFLATEILSARHEALLISKEDGK